MGLDTEGSRSLIAIGSASVSCVATFLQLSCPASFSPQPCPRLVLFCLRFCSRNHSMPSMKSFFLLSTAISTSFRHRALLNYFSSIEPTISLSLCLSLFRSSLSPTLWYPRATARARRSTRKPLVSSLLHYSENIVQWDTA